MHSSIPHTGDKKGFSKYVARYKSCMRMHKVFHDHMRSCVERSATKSTSAVYVKRRSYQQKYILSAVNTFRSEKVKIALQAALFALWLLIFLHNISALEMASSHSLKNVCRVCGSRLSALSFSSKKKSFQYSCAKHKSSLCSAFGIDVEADCPLVHPSNFCSSCYLVATKKEAAHQKGVPYKHSVEVFQWTEHQAEGCTVRDTCVNRTINFIYYN